LQIKENEGMKVSSIEGVVNYKVQKKMVFWLEVIISKVKVLEKSGIPY